LGVGLLLALDTPIFAVIRCVQFVARRTLRRAKPTAAWVVAKFQKPGPPINRQPVSARCPEAPSDSEPAIGALVREMVAEPDPVPIHRAESGPAEVEQNFSLPPISLLDDPEPFPFAEQESRLRERAGLLEKTFTDFGLNVRVVGIN